MQYAFQGSTSLACGFACATLVPCCGIDAEVVCVAKSCRLRKRFLLLTHPQRVFATSTAAAAANCSNVLPAASSATEAGTAVLAAVVAVATVFANQLLLSNDMKKKTRYHQ